MNSNPGMIGVKKKNQSRLQAALSDKRRYLDSIDSYIINLAKQLNNGDSKGVQQLLDFFSAGMKCSRWSYWNLVGLIRQRPVTIREAAGFGHYRKRGVNPVAILVPRVIEVSSSPKPEVPLKNSDVLWKTNAAIRLELFAGNQLLEVWQGPGGWEWLKANYPERKPIASGCAPSSIEAKDSALASLNEEQLRDLAKASATRPQTRTYFNLIRCVVDLGRDTIGPDLMLECNQAAAEVGHILDAVSQYAASVGIEAIDSQDLAADGARDPDLEIRARIRELAHRPTDLQPANAQNGGSTATGRPARNIWELQSEACSYVVSRSLGIESEFSISGLRDCRITKRDLELNLRVIAQISREILHGITPLIKAEEETLAVPALNTISDEEIPESWEDFQRALEIQENPPSFGDMEEGLAPVKATIRATI